MPSPMASDIVGSWFPTGYYGHVRNKPRLDFVCEYRQLAKPQPPVKFVNRSMQLGTKHVFSLHDNRNAIKADAAYFEQGLGRRRNPGGRFTFQPDFYTWMPLKEEIERSRPHLSTYQVDYTRNGVKQLLIKRPKTSFDGEPTTTYRYCHGDEGPNREQLRQTARTALELTTYSRLHRAKTAKAACRETVASCLSWYRPIPPSTPINTEFSMLPFTPAPPRTAPPTVQQVEAPPTMPPVKATPSVQQTEAVPQMPLTVG